MKNFFIINLIFCELIMLLNDNLVFAKEVEIVASGDYIMDSRLDETPASATARAREEAKRHAVEQAGVYVQSYSKMINFELSYDEVTTIAARLLKIQDESSKVEVIEENILKFTVNIKALIDNSNDDDLKTIISNKQALDEAVRRNNELKKEYDDLKKQMDEIKRKYIKANDSQKIKLKESVVINNNYFKAVQELAKGNDFYLQKNYSSALESYSLALTLNPKLVEAYNNRGLIYYELNQYPQAINDYTSALKLRATFVQALNNRGNAYAASGEYQKALQDLQAAIKLANNIEEIHNNLGSVYFSLKNYDEAIKEFTQAIQLNSNYVDAYYNRSAAYYAKGKYDAALSDSKVALKLKPNDSEIKELYKRITQKLSR